MLILPRDGHQAWRKIFLGPKANKRSMSFSRGFTCISKGGESTNKFFKVNTQRKRKGDRLLCFIFFRGN
jgi:hypothetical protein